MSPYLRAHEAYHRDGEPWIPWVDALDFHLQHGVVISTPECFIMARRVVAAWPDHHHLTLRAVADGDAADAWHVWSAAGSLDALLDISRRHPSRQITFQRRDERLHRVAAERLRGGSRGTSGWGEVVPEPRPHF